jgi:hypothetical protein
MQAVTPFCGGMSPESTMTVCGAHSQPLSTWNSPLQAQPSDPPNGSYGAAFGVERGHASGSTNNDRLKTSKMPAAPHENGMARYRLIGG